jgi:hypothetical protein
MLIGIASDIHDIDSGLERMASRSVKVAMAEPWVAERSAASSLRELQTAVTCPREVALMAAMWAVAAHPYPMTAILYFFLMSK